MHKTENQSLHTECNDNGVRLASVAVEARMVVGGTLFPHRDIHKQTWVLPDGRTMNQIDHILVGAKFRNSLIDVRVMKGAECGSRPLHGTGQSQDEE